MSVKKTSNQPQQSVPELILLLNVLNGKKVCPKLLREICERIVDEPREDLIKDYLLQLVDTLADGKETLPASVILFGFQPFVKKAALISSLLQKIFLELDEVFDGPEDKIPNETRKAHIVRLLPVVANETTLEFALAQLTNPQNSNSTVLRLALVYSFNKYPHSVLATNSRIYKLIVGEKGSSTDKGMLLFSLSRKGQLDLLP